MKRLLIREGSSVANDYESHRVLGNLYGFSNAGLSEEGIIQAKSIPGEIEASFPDYAEVKIVATSEARYCIQTAVYAGFSHHNYPLLNNPFAERMYVRDIQESVINRVIPDSVRQVVKDLLSDQHTPPERIWIASGYMIAAISSELGIDPTRGFIPEPTEMRELEF